MSGANVARLPPKHEPPKIIMLTPEIAMSLLEHNGLNRPLTQQHVERIARQITEGKWRFNGDTIKIADTNDVLDGQHRLWAIIEAKKPVETIIVYGIKRDAFSTIDTVRKLRSGGDTIALSGAPHHRSQIATALTWLIRWQRGCLEGYTAPQNKVENSDIETTFADNHGIIRAVERANQIRSICNVSILAFAYYVIFNRNEALAERMMDTLLDPAGVGINDPFFRLRSYFTSDHHKRKEALTSIAVIFKAANASFEGRKIQTLAWKSQGKTAETFPVLKVI